MINLADKSHLEIKQNIIVPSIGASTSLATVVRAWDLNKFRTIITTDILEDDEARKNALHKHQRTKNIVLGALAGGVVDAVIGNDSLLEGILLGAAFGYVCSSSPKEPKAQVGLLFSDGSYLAVEVNKTEYTQLQTIALAQNAQQVQDTDPASIERPLTLKELYYILHARSRQSLANKIMLSVMFACTSLFIEFVFGVINVGRAQQNFFEVLSSDGVSEHATLQLLSLPAIFHIFFPVVGCAALIFTITRNYFSPSKIESFIRNDKELEVYKGLKNG